MISMSHKKSLEYFMNLQIYHALLLALFFEKKLAKQLISKPTFNFTKFLSQNMPDFSKGSLWILNFSQIFSLNQFSPLWGALPFQFLSMFLDVFSRSKSIWRKKALTLAKIQTNVWYKIANCVVFSSLIKVWHQSYSIVSYFDLHLLDIYSVARWR